MACALHTHTADKLACTLQHTHTVDKTAGSMLRKVGTLGRTRKHKRVDNADTLGSGMRTHMADKMAYTPRGRNQSRGDDTWRNRRRRNHRNCTPEHNRK